MTTVNDIQQTLHTHDINLEEHINQAIRNHYDNYYVNPGEITLGYAKTGGKCFNFELYTMKVIVKSLVGFDPFEFDLISDDVEITSQCLVTAGVLFIEQVCDRSKKCLVPLLDPSKIDNFVRLDVIIPMGRLNVPVRVELRALPEYTAGEGQGKTPADLFREVHSREPDMKTVVSTTHVNPTFKIIGID